MAFSPDGLRAMESQRNGSGSVDHDWFKETILSTWGKPKDERVVEYPKLDPPKAEKAKVDPKDDRLPKIGLTDAELEILRKQVKKEVYLGFDVKEVEFSNGDRMKLSGPKGWAIVDKNGKQVTIVEEIDKGMGSFQRYRLSNGATYTSGCFGSSVSYPNGDSISFGIGRVLRGGRVVARS